MKDNSPLTWAARIASLLLHPIWLPLVFATWRCWGDPSLPKLLLVIFICLIAFPGLIALLWMRIRNESDWFVMHQHNRTVPLIAGLVGIAFFAVANRLFFPPGLFQSELMMLLGLLLLIGIVVTPFWKISIHMLSWGAVGMYAFGYSLETNELLPFVFTLVLTLLTAWARLRVKSHDFLQIFIGWVAGIATAILVGGVVPLLLYLASGQ